MSNDPIAAIQAFAAAHWQTIAMIWFCSWFLSITHFSIVSYDKYRRAWFEPLFPWSLLFILVLGPISTVILYWTLRNVPPPRPPQQPSDDPQWGELADEVIQRTGEHRP